MLHPAVIGDSPAAWEQCVFVFVCMCVKRGWGQMAGRDESGGCQAELVTPISQTLADNKWLWSWHLHSRKFSFTIGSGRNNKGAISEVQKDFGERNGKHQVPPADRFCSNYLRHHHRYTFAWFFFGKSLAVRKQEKLLGDNIVQKCIKLSFLSSWCQPFWCLLTNTCRVVLIPVHKSVIWGKH